MGSHIHLFDPGAPVTFTASADVTGGQLQSVTGNRTCAGTTASTAAWIGAAGFDAKAGERVTIVKGGVQKLLAAGAVAAGDVVIPAADGKVAAVGAGNADHRVGIALTAGTDVLVEIDMER